MQGLESMCEGIAHKMQNLLYNLVPVMPQVYKFFVVHNDKFARW